MPLTTRVRSLPERLRSSYWFLPALMMVASAVLAFGSLKLDEWLFGRDGLRPSWIFSSGAEGGRAVLSTIAGSMIGVAGVTFSITMVALAMASNQFGARLLRTFMRDRGNQVVLGTFVATFLYCLLVLRAVRGEGVMEGGLFVPHLSITLSVILAICGLGVLIYYIHHMATMIQAPQVVDAVARELVDAIEHQYPTEHAGIAVPDPDALAWLARDGEDVYAETSGYVRLIDEEALGELAREHGLAFRVLCRPGDFVVAGERFLRVGPCRRLDDRRRRTAAATLVTGANRSIEQDAGFPLQQLVEMAIRALSPGINDPNTAAQCVDRIGQGLALLADRPLPPRVRRFGEGWIERPLTTLPELLEGSFDRVRFYARGADPELAVHMLQALCRIGHACRRDEDHHAVREQARRIQAQLLADTRLTYARREVAELMERVDLVLPPH